MAFSSPFKSFLRFSMYSCLFRAIIPQIKICSTPWFSQSFPVSIMSFAMLSTVVGFNFLVGRSFPPHCKTTTLGHSSISVGMT